MNMINKFTAAIAALALTAAAHAGTGPLPTNSTFEETLTAGTTNTLSFELDGYNSLDGKNFYEDDFSLSVNGEAIFKGTFDLGGGGSNVVYFGSASYFTFVPGSQKVFFTIPVFSDDGTYKIDFTYTSLSKASGHAGFQGLGDEAWGVTNVSLVPEPTSVALLLAGLGMIGGLARRRSQG